MTRVHYWISRPYMIMDLSAYVRFVKQSMLPNFHRFFGVEKVLLPEIRSSAEFYGTVVHDPLKGVTINGVLGDQQAALVGQMCFKKGQAKNT